MFHSYKKSNINYTIHLFPTQFPTVYFNPAGNLPIQLNPENSCMLLKGGGGSEFFRLYQDELEIGELLLDLVNYLQFKHLRVTTTVSAGV